MKRILTLIIFVVGLFLNPLEAFAQTPKIPVELVKILDGDTIEAKINDNVFSVRLIGIDCFETDKSHRAYHQAYDNNLKIDDIIQQGNNSTKYLKQLYKQSNKKVYLDFKGLDYYKRVLGIIYFDELNVNEAMVNYGGCLVY